MTFPRIGVFLAFALLSWTSLQAATPATTAPKETPSPTAAAPASDAPDEKLPSVAIPQFPRAQSKLDGWKQTLNQTEEALHSRDIGDAALNTLRDQTSAAQSGARALISAITAPLEAATARAAQLAPDPKATTPQTDDVKQERAKLLADVAARQSIVQQAKLINVRAQQSLDKISDRRRTIFADSVLQRSDSLISPSFWMGVASAVPLAASRLIDLFSGWIGVLASQLIPTAVSVILAAAVLLGFFLSPGRRWQARLTTRNPSVTSPTALRKTSSATTIVFVGTAIPGLALLVFYQAVMALGVLPENISSVVQAVLFGVTFAFFFVSLTKAVLAPERPSWRLVALDDAAAEGMIPISVLLAFVIVFGVLLDAANAAINAPVELTAASQGVVAIAKALLFMAAFRVATGPDTDDDETAAGNAKRSAWRLLIPVGWVAAVATILTPLAGYVAFGRFLSIEMVVVVAVLMSLVLLTQFAEALISATFAFQGRIGRFLRQTAGLGSSAVRQIAAVLEGFVKLSLVGLAAFVVLTTWGIHSDDVVGSLSSAFFSLTIGGFTISPSAILGAIVVLIIGIAATGTIQRWLEGRFLPETNLDVGVRSSIRTGAGYIGVIFAVIVALSYVGLNLQNVAIVAGALSVGIGFGLQSIINNFVSGLILLVERPIKVGDRIEVGARMGVVKRINVRATEIVTYDNLSVIVPNAELISGQVVNWMHGSFSARLSVMVGTSYDADPDKVMEILLDIATHNERVLKSPAPFAIFSNFGADALEFTVFFHVGNIGTDAGASNDIRLAILKRFRKEGIEIPFTQRDVNIRGLDRVEALLRDASGANSENSKPTKSTPPPKRQTKD